MKRFLRIIKLIKIRMRTLKLEIKIKNKIGRKKFKGKLCNNLETNN